MIDILECQPRFDVSFTDSDTFFRRKLGKELVEILGKETSKLLISLHILPGEL